MRPYGERSNNNPKMCGMRLGRRQRGWSWRGMGGDSRKALQRYQARQERMRTRAECVVAKSYTDEPSYEELNFEMVQQDEDEFWALDDYRAAQEETIELVRELREEDDRAYWIQRAWDTLMSIAP